MTTINTKPTRSPHFTKANAALTLITATIRDAQRQIAEWRKDHGGVCVTDCDFCRAPNPTARDGDDLGDMTEDTLTGVAFMLESAEAVLACDYVELDPDEAEAILNADDDKDEVDADAPVLRVHKSR